MTEVFAEIFTLIAEVIDVMAGETRVLKFSEGLSVSAPDNSSLYSNSVKQLTGTTYTFIDGDQNNVIMLSENTADAKTFTIDQDIFQIGDTLAVIQLSTGIVTWAAGTGVTINSSSTLDHNGPYSMVAAVHIQQNVWVLTGERA